MANTHFRVEGLPSCYHDDETKRIFEQCINSETTITKLVTAAIVEYANELGFTIQLDNGRILKPFKPSYIDDKRFEYILAKIAKSRGKDYTYLMAFEYLRLHHSGASSSFIQREAIKSSTC